MRPLARTVTCRSRAKPLPTKAASIVVRVFEGQLSSLLLHGILDNGLRGVAAHAHGAAPLVVQRQVRVGVRGHHLESTPIGASRVGRPIALEVGERFALEGVLAVVRRLLAVFVLPRTVNLHINGKK